MEITEYKRDEIGGFMIMVKTNVSESELEKDFELLEHTTNVYKRKVIKK